ncbi:sigma-70 family RNA polymerase sigma factor [Clostridium cellulovorans]|uniref:RNA polymerase, sigma-24 subunit, ECF subfamily n=1 Tax=Clostridium cellulovorans (strain ATCC 35296 / DSM 3052 / OCM 3 / 743B) TaxID=573061 RepID=D9STQ8_CLOC7|nr:sigma-70 family RNA polymerase sigma factor [Clostridium cellulovorans]ADL52792.1 RNA polymerase, sigma-24 subunit, ECF subfamily [Clostridium cellulovorans 743B]
MSLHETISKSINGDLSSYEYLVNEFQGLAITYAYSILRDYQLAEDAAQEAFILLFLNIKNLKEPLAFVSWLKKLTFTCCNRITRKKNLEVYDEDLEQKPSDKSITKIIEISEKATLVQESLSLLTNDQKEAIILHYYLDKKYSDIANMLGITETAVANRIYSGKKKLKKIMLITMKDYLVELSMNKDSFTRKVLEQVPNITTQDPRVQENFQFCGCMRAIMQYLNKDSSLDFIYFAGITGALFCNVWSYNPKWQYSESTVSFFQYNGRQEIIVSAFRSIGYKCEIVSEIDLKENTKKYLKKIVESLDSGFPVMTYGIVGPPTCSLITGYDEGGEVLIGWSAFQNGDHGFPDGYEPCGYYRKRNGLDESYGLIFFGEECEPMNNQDIVKTALKNIKQVVNLPKTNRNLYGIDAYTAWAEAFLQDKDFIENASELDTYLDVHCGQKVIVMTGRTYGAEFLSRLKNYDSPYNILIDKLIDLCEKENAILNKFWQLEPSFYFDSKNLINQNYRRQMVDIILEASEIYNQFVHTCDL